MYIQINCTMSECWTHRNGVLSCNSHALFKHFHIIVAIPDYDHDDGMIKYTILKMYSWYHGMRSGLTMGIE